MDIGCPLGHRLQGGSKMKRYQYVALLVVTTVSVGWAQSTQVWIEPAEPVAWEPITLYVSGVLGPTYGYSLQDTRLTWRLNTVTVEMFWTGPRPGMQFQTFHSYEEQVDLGSLPEGRYTAKVQVYVDGHNGGGLARTRFEVRPGEDSSQDAGIDSYDDSFDPWGDLGDLNRPLVLVVPSTSYMATGGVFQARFRFDNHNPGNAIR